MLSDSKPLERSRGFFVRDYHYGMKFLRSIPDLPVNARLRLEKKGLTTPAKLMATTDEELLKIKGLGPMKVRIIRRICEASEQRQPVLE